MNVEEENKNFSKVRNEEKQQNRLLHITEQMAWKCKTH